MQSLRVKLLVAFVVVAVLAVAVVAVAARRATDRAFLAYVHQTQSQRLQRVAAELAAFYARNQSWANVQQTLEASLTGAGMGRMVGPMMGMGRATQGEVQQAILADTQGVVVASAGTAYGAPRLSERDLATALPIVVGSNTVGYLLGRGPGISSFSALEQDFITSVNRAVIAASLIAGLVAIVLSLAIAQRLTGPLVSMTRAASAMAQGDLSQRVDVASGDEIGRLAEAFNTMAASLARAEELRRNLVADVAHELRTPLAVLRADLEALQDGVYEPTPERLATLREETDLLARLVNDLHELSLAEAGQLALERRPTDLAHLCEQTVAAMQPQATSRGVSLVMADAQEAVAAVDADRIGQVLRNLISNALRHTPAGGSVTVSCQVQGGDALLMVKDTGTGIKPEDLPYIFDRFYRGEKSRSRATGGAGLGLAIVKQLVEAHGGSAWAESTAGQGATFFVRLPLAWGIDRGTTDEHK